MKPRRSSSVGFVITGGLFPNISFQNWIVPMKTMEMMGRLKSANRI